MTGGSRGFAIYRIHQIKSLSGQHTDKPAAGLRQENSPYRTIADEIDQGMNRLALSG